MADSGINIANLPVAIGVTGDDYIPLDQAGVTKRAKASAIANTATGFVPTSRRVDAGVGLSGGGTLASDVTIDFAPDTLFAATTMAAGDTFVIQQALTGTPRQIVFADAMKGIGVLPSSPPLNLTADKFLVLRAADGETYSATATQISIAAGNVPAGGTTGQVLAKLSSTNYDTAWISNAIILDALSIAANPTGVQATSTSVTLGATLAFSGSSLRTAAGTGDVVWSANSFVTTISNNAVTDAKFRQSVAVSVVGNATNATANVADIVGTANQILRLNGAGTALAFGSIDLAQSAAVGASILGVSNGGTAASLTASNGGIVYSTASAMAILAGTATAGQHLQSGSSAAPSWTTATFPSTAAAGTILAAGTANTITATAAPTLGVAGTTLGTLGFAGNTSGTVTIQPQAAAGTYNFNLPTSAGTSGQPLLSGGGGATAMSFGTLGIAGGGTGTGTAFTAGSVVFAGASGVYTQDNSNLFWDNTNKRLGIGTTSPAVKADIVGNAVIGTGTRSEGNVRCLTLQGATAYGQLSIISTVSDGEASYACKATNISNGAAGHWLFGSSIAATNKFSIGNGGSWGQFVIDTSGNVGIGTTGPGDILTVAGNTVPSADNTYTCGKSGARWSAVWAANGTIQTSDQRQKTGIEDSALGLSWINALRPVSYKWTVGQNEEEKTTESYTSEEQVMEEVTVTEESVSLVNGKWTKTSQQITRWVPVFDEHTLYDETGSPVMRTDEVGNIVAVKHRVPRMQTVTKTREIKNYTPRAGSRRHYGLLAQEVKTALTNAGVSDFGGWILTDKDDPNSEQGLRYDQFISPLIKAVQELTARVAVLEAGHRR